MPAGRLREGLDAATGRRRGADHRRATTPRPIAIGRAFGIAPVFRVTRTIGAPRRGRRRSRLGGRAVELARVRRHRHRAAGPVHRRHPVGRLGHLWRRSSSAITTGSPRATCGASPPQAKATGVDDRADHGEGRACGSPRAIWAICRSPRSRWSSASNRPTQFQTLAARIAIRSQSAIRSPQSRRNRDEAPPRVPDRARADRGRPRDARRSWCARAAPLLGLAFYAIDARTGASRSATWRRRFPRGRRPSAPRDRTARPSPISGGCCSSCCSSRRLSREQMLARVGVRRRGAVRGSPTLRAKGVLFITGHFGFWELQAMVHARARPSRSASWRARSTTRISTACSRTSARAPATPCVYRRGTIRRVMRTLQAGPRRRRADRSAHHEPRRDLRRTSSSGRRRRRRRSRRWRCAPARRWCRCSRCRSAAGATALIYEHQVEPPRADSPDAVREFTQRCTDVLEMYAAAIRSCGCGCTAAGATMADGRRTSRGMFPSAERAIVDGVAEERRRWNVSSTDCTDYTD